MMRLFLLLLPILLSAVASFGPSAQRHFGLTKKVSTLPLLFGGIPVDYTMQGRSFQIEEMEDRDSCTTEIVLNPDLSVTVLATNGPKFLKASGSWKKEDDGTFELEIQRVYEAGVESKFASDVGPFTYATLRKFRGRMSKIGSKLGVEGTVLDGLNDEKKLGYFEMIDTTVGEEGEESLKMYPPKSSSS